MPSLPDFKLNDSDGGATVALTGPLLVSTAAAIDRRLEAISAKVTRVDLSGVTDMDTVGAWLAWRTAHGGRDSGERGRDAEIIGASAQGARLIDAVKGSHGDAATTPPRPGALDRVSNALGAHLIALAHGTVAMIGFIGLLITTAGQIARDRSRFRGKALVHQMEVVGVTSLGIIGLMSFLIGIVIAQQGAVQLQQFGAEVYTVNLTGRLATRELGVLMTAIMVAGRSGSAFAAELGTMKLTEEIDAMRTIGVSPLDALVLPRVAATVVMMPLLGIYSAVIAIIGGATLAALTLNIPFFSFLLRIRDVVPAHDVWVALIKAVMFGLIISLAGCYQGMQVKGNSEEVGLRTTKAVVQGIFMVIVLDAFFAVFFTRIGWG